MVPFKGVNDTIRCLINNNIGKIETQPVGLSETEKQKYEDYRILKDLDPEDPILFQSDDVPKQFEIFRMNSMPKKYEDFVGHRLAIIKTNESEETRKSSAAFDDSIRPNQKYYYMFRSVDIHDNISLPTEVYEVEMIDNDGVVFPVINVVQIEKKNMNTPSKSFRRFMKIKPATSQLFFDDEQLSGDTATTDGVNLGLTEKSVWGEEFTLRLTSKQTGKKIDINFKFVNKPPT